MKSFTLYAIVIVFTFGSSFSTSCKAQAPLLYGMTISGGTNNEGVIFNFNPTNDSEKVVWNFDDTDGEYALGSFAYDSVNGLFYGMTVEGGSAAEGTIISFNPVKDSEKVVWNFTAPPSSDGGTGIKLLYNAGKGLFYGMIIEGGSHGAGVIISFNPANDSEKVLWNFDDTDGQNPTGLFVYDTSDGLFYGMTHYGGSNNAGTVFSFNPADNSEKVVWNFDNGTDGSLPYGNFVSYPNNKLFYGMTSTGGINDDGTIISFNPVNDSVKGLWSFGGSPADGKTPYGDLVYDPNNGLFYGMTSAGGTNSVGTIFSFNAADDSEKVVWSFGGGTDGSVPYESLVYDSANGLFYGMTEEGGAYGHGIIVSFNPKGNVENVVWNFNGTDGQVPSGNLLLYSPKGSTAINTISKPVEFVNFYPNPATSNFIIQTTSPGKQLLQVFDVTGKLLLSQNIYNSKTTIDASNFADGIYLFSLKSNEGVTTEKLVVVR